MSMLSNKYQQSKFVRKFSRWCHSSSGSHKIIIWKFSDANQFNPGLLSNRDVYQFDNNMRNFVNKFVHSKIISYIYGTKIICKNTQGNPSETFQYPCEDDKHECKFVQTKVYEMII